jgi:hypothetical protein
MKPFRQYGTFVVANVREANLIEQVGVKRHWRITTRDDPTFRHWCDASGYKTAEYTRQINDHAKRFPADQPSKEVIIATAGADAASNLSSIIYG